MVRFSGGCRTISSELARLRRKRSPFRWGAGRIQRFGALGGTSMRIVLRVSSSNQDWDGGCAFAVIELNEVLATLAQRRIAALREKKNVDLDVDEVYYWASWVECYFSPWGDLISGDEEVEGTGVALAELLDELQVERRKLSALQTV